MNTTMTEQLIEQLFYSDEWSYNTIFSVLGSVSSFLVFLKTYRTHYIYKWITNRKQLRDDEKRREQQQIMMNLFSQMVSAESKVMEETDLQPNDLRMRIARRKRTVVQQPADDSGDIDQV